MKIFDKIEEITDMEPTVVAMGNFDGVHKGHQELISRTVSTAKDTGMKSAVFTFSNHPRNLIGKEPKVKNILYKEDKIRIIDEMHVDYMFNIPFTEEIMHMSPENYISKLLVGKFNMQEAYCGFNYRFGYHASGDVETLMRYSMEGQFGLHVLEPYKLDGNIISSTLIRSLIEEGDMEKTHSYLGRCYAVGGEVVVGNKLGKTIGFPTSNLMLDDDMVSPPNGVYVTYCTYNGVRYPSITNVGVKPTIGVYNKNVETHIFNFDKELYGKVIRVEFMKRTRPEYKFNSLEELKKQITNDCISARAYHRQIKEV